MTLSPLSDTAGHPVLKGAIFLDMENLSRSGGWNIQFEAVKALVAAQRVELVRANAYMAIDIRRERLDEEYRKKKLEYRGAVQRAGFRISLKEVQRFQGEDDEWSFKANADVDLAVDALLQAQPLDYVLLGTGDGDFLRLVEALQNQGKRVDLLSFENTSAALKRQVDRHFSGYLYPGVLPNYGPETERKRGYLHMVHEEKGFGFATIQTGLAPDQRRADVFVHISNFRGALDNRRFAQLKTDERVLEFALDEDAEGGTQAVEIEVVD